MANAKAIHCFRARDGFLSNFAKMEPLTLKSPDGTSIDYPSVEHYFQAMKTLDHNVRKAIANHHSVGLKAFCSEVVDLREDWEDIKIHVMYRGLCWKFGTGNPELREKLKKTEGRMLYEGNRWGDLEWGVCLDKLIEGEVVGKNTLGRLLMMLRKKILEEDQQ